MVVALLLTCCVSTLLFSCTSVAVTNKRVMLWTTNDLANTNETVRMAYLAELASVKDVVDVVSPCSYYIQQEPPHGLIRKKGANALHTALRQAGFKLQPLVGDISGGWNISWYRETFGEVYGPTFADAAAQEILDGNFEGLNWDYEPHQPGTLNDSVLYGHMVRNTIYQSRHPVSSIDFPCDGSLCDPASLAANTPSTIKLMDMSTYGGSNTSNESQWVVDMRAHMGFVGGSSRYGMGVCPSCSRGLTAAQISARLAAAEAAGVEEIDVWANVDSTDPDATLWWAALRKWKHAKPPPILHQQQRTQQQPRCTNLTGPWTDGGSHPTSNTRIEQNGSVVLSFGRYGDGVGTLTGLDIASMAFHSPPMLIGSYDPRAARRPHDQVPATQTAVLSPDCANFWFCGSVKADPSPATCSTGAHWVRGTTKGLPPAPAPPGPPAPPPPPGNAVQELTGFPSNQCVGSGSALQGTWKYETCSPLVPSAVPGYIALRVNSVRATLGPSPHLNVSFELFSDTRCSAPLLPSKAATLHVTLNACRLVQAGAFSRFQGFEQHAAHAIGRYL
jgi:hypothetical protein